MKKSRKEQGITLIALIITIIVLLILALVTINAIQGDGDLIAHANNAKTLYSQAGENENAVVADYLEYIDENILGNGDDKGTVIVSKGLVLRYNEDTKQHEYYAKNELSSSEVSQMFGEEGATYKGTNLTSFLEGDFYFPGGAYFYTYEIDKTGNGSWNVRGSDDSATTISEIIPTSIFDIPVTSMEKTFDGFSSLESFEAVIPTCIDYLSYCFNQTLVSEIKYAGTIDQFKNINGYDDLGYDDSGKKSITVKCSDGDLVL